MAGFITSWRWLGLVVVLVLVLVLVREDGDGRVCPSVPMSEMGRARSFDVETRPFTVPALWPSP